MKEPHIFRLGSCGVSEEEEDGRSCVLAAACLRWPWSQRVLWDRRGPCASPQKLGHRPRVPRTSAADSVPQMCSQTASFAIPRAPKSLGVIGSLCCSKG